MSLALVAYGASFFLVVSILLYVSFRIRVIYQEPFFLVFFCNGTRFVFYALIFIYTKGFLSSFLGGAFQAQIHLHDTPGCNTTASKQSYYKYCSLV